MRLGALDDVRRHLAAEPVSLVVVTQLPRLLVHERAAHQAHSVPSSGHAAPVRVRLSAYPLGHPDAGFGGRSADEHERDLVELLGGQAVGPVLEDASAVVVDAADTVVGAVVVTRVDPEAGDGRAGLGLRTCWSCRSGRATASAGPWRRGARTSSACRDRLTPGKRPSALQYRQA